MEEEIEKSEAKIQQSMYMWYHNSFCLAHHNPRMLCFPVPNQAHQNIALVGGVYSGVSDLVIMHNKRAYMVEVKIPGGHVRPSQKKFRSHCEQSGIPYYIVDNLEDFKALVASW